MERTLVNQIVEGEVSLVIDYQPGKSVAIDVLQGAMRLIESLDRLDGVLLSSVNTSLEPVSVLNDVQHSSLKMMLARALRGLSDDHLGNLEWKKWVGSLLVKGKHKLLQHLDADAPEIRKLLIEMEPDYSSMPQGLVGYTPPQVADVQAALVGVSKARATLPGQHVTIQTELGDISLPETEIVPDALEQLEAQTSVTNKGVEYFKIKSLDLLGKSQWTLLRNQKPVKVDMLHQRWLDDYHERKIPILPGDSIESHYEETISYDANHNEIERKIAIVEVVRVIPPPSQQSLNY
ncbi:MAG: hypothetical protein KKH12_15575 [Gammaproteobacteria bacterium]|nr:hypothetical protein [Gammaproteobacteria bacterium]MBU1483084.1 hypothetical protein [Gammaproteobacteria bacterium]